MKDFIFGARKNFKKIAFIFTLFSIITSSVFANEVLTGDARSACEVILCLSSGTRPAECASSLARYFSIKLKKPWQTIDARRSFLSLCPIQSDSNIEDLVLNNLVDDVLPNSDPKQCTPEYLNTQVDRKNNTYRTTANMPGFCHALINHQYTDYKIPKYKCSGEFYSALEWQLSAKLELINFKDYQKLEDKQRYVISRTCGHDNQDICYTYFKKIPFSKICWSY